MFAALLCSLLALAAAQNVSVPATCIDGFFPGSDEVIYHLPYTYNEVLAVIADFGDLTWSGNPPSTVHLNGTDNRVGTARSYSLQGISTVETLTQYHIPPCPGPYREVHNTAEVNYEAVGIRAYMMYDGEELTTDCLGKASVLNMTTHFCSNKPEMAAQLLHQVHMADAVNVGKMLGGRNFTTCNNLIADPFALVCPYGLPVIPKSQPAGH